MELVSKFSEGCHRTTADFSVLAIYELFIPLDLRRSQFQPFTNDVAFELGKCREHFGHCATDGVAKSSDAWLESSRNPVGERFGSD